MPDIELLVEKHKSIHSDMHPKRLQAARDKIVKDCPEGKNKVINQDFILHLIDIALLDQELTANLLKLVSENNKTIRKQDKEIKRFKNIALDARDDLSHLYGSLNVKWSEWSDSDYWSARAYQAAKENAWRVMSQDFETVSVKVPGLIEALVAESKHYSEALRFIADQFCRRRPAKGDEFTPCTSTGDCITEYCLPCYAKTALSCAVSEES